MTSNRPLPPGDASSRAEVWRRWLLHTVPGRVLLVGLAIKALVALVGFVVPSTWAALDIVDALGSLALIFLGGYAIAKGAFWAKRRLLWRVRRKLILSYVFVGLVPGLLIIAFFLIAGLVLFFNVSSFLLQSRMRTLADQARFMSQSAVLETEHGDPTDVLRTRLGERQKIAAERYPFASVAIVPTDGLDCRDASARQDTTPRPMTMGPWAHLAPPERLPRWIRCDGFVGLLLYEVRDRDRIDYRLVMRSVALPDTRTPRWAAIVDLPLTTTIEERLRSETGVRVGAVSPPPEGEGCLRVPVGRRLEPPPERSEDSTGALGQEWVTVLDVHDWQSGARCAATVNMQLNLPEIYNRISTIPGESQFGQILLLVLAFIGVLFLTIQFVALVIGFVLARQITGAVHDLFTGTQHLRNRDFTYHIPLRARDQLGELADSFNVMTGEITKLIRENAEKARMEQEMLAAREIQQRLLPSGTSTSPASRSWRSANRRAKSPATTSTS